MLAETAARLALTSSISLVSARGLAIADDEVDFMGCGSVDGEHWLDHCGQSDLAVAACACRSWKRLTSFYLTGHREYDDAQRSPTDASTGVEVVPFNA